MVANGADAWIVFEVERFFCRTSGVLLKHGLAVHTSTWMLLHHVEWPWARSPQESVGCCSFSRRLWARPWNLYLCPCILSHHGMAQYRVSVSEVWCWPCEWHVLPNGADQVLLGHHTWHIGLRENTCPSSEFGGYRSGRIGGVFPVDKYKGFTRGIKKI